MNRTKHAETRTQQRSIPPLIVNLLLAYGREQHDHRGAVRHFFDKSSWRHLERELGHAITRQWSHYKNTYAVTAEGRILTVGHRNKRMPNA